jgi:ATP-dependent Clp protease ATP-binding subunit ClpC
MGARPLRRAIQRYIEDPLADEVLRAGPMTPGSTVMFTRDASGDEEDKPLRLEIIPPSSKSPLEEGDRPKVGVGAKSGEGDGVHGTEDSGPDAEHPES